MDLVNPLEEALNSGNEAEKRNAIEKLLQHLGFGNCRSFQKYDVLLTLIATDTITQEIFLVAVWSRPEQSVKFDAVEHFCSAVEKADVNGGLFLTTGAMNVRRTTKIPTSKPVTLLGKNELMRQLSSTPLFASSLAAAPSLFDKSESNDTDKDKAPTTSDTSLFSTSQGAMPVTSWGKQQPPLRSRTKLLRVTFPDGKVFCDSRTSQTLIQVVRYIGIERVQSAGLVVAHCPFITREVPPSLTEWSKPLDDEWNIILQSDTDQRHRQLLAINNKLELGMKIEVGNFDPITSTTKKEESRKAKSRLEIKLADGYIINASHATDSYIAFMKYVGVDKLKRLNLKLSGKSLITSTKQYNDQVLVSSTCWLTVPTSNKLKYRAIKVVASMAHISVDVKIV